MAIKQTREKPAKDKYSLRTLHEEIALYDRKLAHLHKYEIFASDSERTVAADKLNAKRNLLVRDARALIDSGIEYKSSELPRSLRPAEQPSEEPSGEPANQAPAATGLKLAQPAEDASQKPSPSLQDDIQSYLQKRHRTPNYSAAS